MNRAYELSRRLEWDDEVDEKEWMLARLAFLAWNQARLLVDYPEAKRGKLAAATTARSGARSEFPGTSVSRALK